MNNCFSTNAQVLSNSVVNSVNKESAHILLQCCGDYRVKISQES